MRNPRPQILLKPGEIINDRVNEAFQNHMKYNVTDKVNSTIRTGKNPLKILSKTSPPLISEHLHVWNKSINYTYK